MANAVQEGVYAQYFNSVIQMARREGGVSRPELIHALGISRTLADGLIARCKLRRSRTDGKTEFFSVSRGTQKVADTKETNMTDATPNPADPKGLVAAVVGEQPGTAPGKGKKPKNRLPVEDQTPTTVPTAPAPPVSAPAPAIAGRKTAAQLDEEIQAIRAVIADATRKSAVAHETHLTQKARAESFGQKLTAALQERLAIS